MRDEDKKELSKTSCEITLDDVGKRYVRINQTEGTKNYQGGSHQSDQDYHDVRMYETNVNSLLDLVNSCKFYRVLHGLVLLINMQKLHF